MQSIAQSLSPRPASDKVFDRPQLVFSSRFKSARVVENISIVVREGQFIVNIVTATLLTGYT